MTGPHLLSRQRGASMWTIIVLVAVVGFLVTLAFRLLPAYITNFDVKSVIQALPGEPNIGNMTNYDVRKVLNRRFDVNRIEVIKANCRAHDPSPCVKLERTKSTLIVDANYEVRIHVMGNVDAVVMFGENRVEIPLKGD